MQEEVLEPHLPAVLARARQGGVDRQVVNGTHEGDWERVRDLARAHSDLVPCFGLHPWFVADRSPGWLERLRGALQSVPSAVGEIGLDRWVRERDEAAQEAVFAAQLRLATELCLPVMIHCLRAWGWLLDTLRREGAPPAGMLIHAFGGAPEMVPPLAEMGAFFSFGGSVLDERKLRARRALQAVPLERLLVETDAPALLPPEPCRRHVTVGEGGEALNEPANLPCIVEGIARLRGLKAEALRELTWENARRLFGEGMLRV